MKAFLRAVGGEKFGKGEGDNLPLNDGFAKSLCVR